MVILFAAAATGCKKESEITPGNGINTPPVNPVATAVSTKPRSIITSENGTDLRKQIYEYDAQGKLTKYESTGTSSDSVLVNGNSVTFKRPGSNNAVLVLTFNPDKTFKASFTANTQFDFINNQSKLSRMTQASPNNIPATDAVFNYTNNNIGSMASEIRVELDYFDNLPYQKGINEIPIALKPIKYYKIMEQENATSTVLYNKMLRSVSLVSGSRRETHEYTYAFDADRRVTQINELITNSTATSSSQRILKSSVSY